MLTLVLLFAFTSCIFAQSRPRIAVVDAAFRYEEDLFLIAGPEFMAISPEGYERYVRSRHGETEVPVQEHVQAAVTWPWKDSVMYFGPDVSYRTNQTTKQSKVATYGQDRTFLQGGGPDAAAFRQGRFYIFKGCKYVTPKGTLQYLGDEHDSEAIGLPCNPDAAWTDTDYKGLTILKGNEIWHWGDDVEGPFPFDRYYHIHTWRLRHEPDDRFEL